MHNYTDFSTPLGTLTLIASPDALVEVLFDGRHTERSYDTLSKGSNPILEKAIKELIEYFDGRRKNFDVPVTFEHGTELEKKTWTNLSKIPYGKTISYGELARMNNRPRAYRAAGTANGKNPLPIIVPCHRVIASNGGIGGYSGGLETKKYLIKLEENNL